MIREYLSVDREVNAIRLQRSTFSGAFLLVEGSSDKTFYGRFINPQTCTIVVASGKLKVLGILEILDNEDFQGILAIVDADFDRLEPPTQDSPNLLRTDTHDLETLLLKSPAFDKVLSEFGSEDKICRLGRDIRTLLLQAGMPIGYLRWISQIHVLNLKFSEITFSKFIDEKTLQLDEAKLIQTIKHKSESLALKDQDLQQQMAQQKNSSHNPWQICCGHDLVEILALGLRKMIGSANAAEIHPDILERSLRLAYEQTYFLKTQLYCAIRHWESNNKIFTVLQ